jgi:tRNA(Ile)-lysidine synthetase-like protein
MALAVLLQDTLPPGRVICAVLDHGIREGSAEEAREVTARAERLGFRAVSERAEVPEEALTRGKGLEEAGRAARYAFLERVRKEHACQSVLTAHHAGDNAETVVMKLVRGAGPGALMGIPFRSGRVLRPLLGFTRRELRDYLEFRGMDWIEDPSNADELFSRNRIRHRVMPVFTDMNPRFVEAVARGSELAAGEEAFWEERLGRLELELVRPAGPKVSRRSTLASGRPAAPACWTAGKGAGFRQPGGGGTGTGEERGVLASGEGGLATVGGRGVLASGEGGLATGGEWGVLASGEGGLVTAGERGDSASSEGGFATAGERGVLASGEGGLVAPVERGDSALSEGGLVTAGERGVLASSEGGLVKVGDRGVLASGEGGLVTPGERGVLALSGDGFGTAGDRDVSAKERRGPGAAGEKDGLAPGEGGLGSAGAGDFTEAGEMAAMSDGKRGCGAAAGGGVRVASGGECTDVPSGSAPDAAGRSVVPGLPAAGGGGPGLRTGPPSPASGDGERAARGTSEPASMETGPFLVDLEGFARLHLAERRRLLGRLIRKVRLPGPSGGEPSQFRSVEMALEFLEGPGGAGRDLPGGRRVERRGNSLYVGPASRYVP